MARLALCDEIALVAALCRDLGHGVSSPIVLKTAHHTTLLLQPLPIVARVQSAESIEAARLTADTELAVGSFLQRRSAPALGPLEGNYGPYVVDTCVVTLWPFVQQARVAEESDIRVAATTLKSIHDALTDYDGELPTYLENLDRCWKLLSTGDFLVHLPRLDRAMLRSQYRRLRQLVLSARSEHRPLHGDVHLGNLLIGQQGPVWIDFENACVGPLEYDVAGLPPEAWQLFDGIDQMLVQHYAELKSVCVATWCWADFDRSAEMREAAEFHIEQVRAMPLSDG